MSEHKEEFTDAFAASTIDKNRSKAEEYVRDPEKSRHLLERALKKAKDNEKNKGPLAELWISLKAFFRLLQAYVRREYTDISWASIVIVAVAIIYFVSPIDLIPDWIPIAGFFDDAAIIAFVLSKIKVELDTFLKWEAVHPAAHPDGTA